MNEVTDRNMLNIDQVDEIEKLLAIDINKMQLVLGDDKDFFLEIFEIMQSQIPKVLKGMYEYVDEGDNIKLSSIAHRFKSTVNILGNVYLTTLIKEIESKGKENADNDLLHALVVKLEVACNILEGHIDEVILQLKS